MSGDSIDGPKTEVTVDDFARLKKEWDKITSLTRLQILIVAVGAIILVLFLGFIGIAFLGQFWGSILASVLSVWTLVGIIEGARERNFQTHLERKGRNK